MKIAINLQTFQDLETMLPNNHGFGLESTALPTLLAELRWFVLERRCERSWKRRDKIFLSYEIKSAMTNPFRLSTVYVEVRSAKRLHLSEIEDIRCPRRSLIKSYLISSFWSHFPRVRVQATDAVYILIERVDKIYLPVRKYEKKNKESD